MGIGRSIEDGGYVYRELENAESLSKDNLVVEINSSGRIRARDGTSAAYGIAARSTLDRIQRSVGSSVYLTGSQLNGTKIPVYRSGVARLNLLATHTAIAIGQRIVVATGTGSDGHVAPTSTAVSTVAHIVETIGYAEEAKAANSGGTVLVALKLFQGGSP